MADGEPRAKRTRGSQAPTLPPALRERFFVVDNFLPLELATAMRAQIDAHFSDPGAHRPDTHQVWNYWFVPELYAYLRTQPEKVIARPLVERFFEGLRSWSAQSLGLATVSWPYLSLYVDGCRQNVHNDSTNGRFGFVYSLTKPDRKTIGGETIVYREGDAFRALRDQSGAGQSFYDTIEPRFNRLVVFDDRLPHAVERIEGSMDPKEGRFVLHGHLQESEPVVAGALSPEAVMPPAQAVVRGFTESNFLDGYHGPLTAMLDIAPAGQVSACRLLLDRVSHGDPADTRWPGLLTDLVGRLEAMQFPAANAPSRLLLPILFGALPKR